jgi:hypothetical protein
VGIFYRRGCANWQGWLRGDKEIHAFTATALDQKVVVISRKFAQLSIAFLASKLAKLDITCASNFDHKKIPQKCFTSEGCFFIRL